MKSVTLLGATGSVGASAADILLQQRDRFRVEAVVAADNVGALAELAVRLRARAAAIADGGKFRELKAGLAGTGIEALAGAEGVIETAQRPADIVVGAIAGTAGLRPTHAALSAGRRIALANKECLVCAGAALMRDAAAAGAEIMPVRLRAQCDFSGARRRSRKRCRGEGLDGVRRAVPDLDPGAHRSGRAGRRARASDLVDGAKDHGQFSGADEQRIGTD